MSSIGYSQVDNSKDSLIIITEYQGKQILDTYYQLQEYKQLDSLCESRSGAQDSLIKDQSIQMNRLKIMYVNSQDINGLSNAKIDLLNKEIKSYISYGRRQCFYKWASIVIGGLATSSVVYMSFIK